MNYFHLFYFFPGDFFRQQFGEYAGWAQSVSYNAILSSTHYPDMFIR